jgi:hypothetical protein
MKLHILLASIFLALAACGGSGDGGLGPGSPGDGGGGGGNPVEPGDSDDTPIAESADTCTTVGFTCRGDISRVVYDSGSNTLEITSMPFDRAELNAIYIDTGDNIGDFDVYTNAYGAPPANGFIDTYEAVFTTNGDISVGVVGVEGYQTFGYKGMFYSLDNPATLPNNALVQYTGSYAGLMDFFGNGELHRTSGDLTIDADFTDDVIRGWITNREVLTDGSLANDLRLVAFDGTAYVQELPDILLVNTELVDGTFDGRAVSYIDEDVYEEGSYIGLIAGTDGASIGGLVEVTANDAFPNVVGYDPESRDTGAFITTTRDVIGTDP